MTNSDLSLISTDELVAEMERRSKARMPTFAKIQERILEVCFPPTMPVAVQRMMEFRILVESFVLLLGAGTTATIFEAYVTDLRAQAEREAQKRGQDEAWIREMAAREDGCTVSVGGLITDLAREQSEHLEAQQFASPDDPVGDQKPDTMIQIPFSNCTWCGEGFQSGDAFMLDGFGGQTVRYHPECWRTSKARLALLAEAGDDEGTDHP